ncbi:MAG TPA: hypothetical protein VES95_13360 [Dermatophilaceae bacterium]|nr:hypothetical protein [Dermatophilaceae bacterium]
MADQPGAGLPASVLPVLGGPRGRRAVPPRPGAVLAVLALLAAVPVGFAVLRQRHCLQEGWGGSAPLWRACYSDLVTSVQTAGLGRGLPAYLAGEVTLDQPVLSGSVMTLVAAVVPGGDLLATQRWYLVAWAVLAAAAVALTALLVATTRGHSPDPLQVVLSPVVALGVLLSPDVLGVALATGGIWAWSRRRPALAGALLGLGVMTRTHPLLVVAVLALHAVRARRERDLAPLLLGAVLAAAVVAAPFLVAAPGTLTQAWSTWWGGAAGLGSPWYLPTLAGHPLPGAVVTGLAVGGWALALGLAAVLALGAPRVPPVGPVVLVALAVVLVTGSSFPVQASLWLVPLVAVSGLRWRDHLGWAGAEAVHFVAVWLYVGGLGAADRALPPGWYAVALLVRLAAVGWLARCAWRAATAEDRFAGEVPATGRSLPPVPHA